MAKQSDATTVSKFVNGNVAIEKLNGLEVPSQSMLFLRNTLLDLSSYALTEALVVAWRRNSERQLTGEVDPQGHQKKNFS